jgi:hypothetical protein
LSLSARRACARTASACCRFPNVVQRRAARAYASGVGVIFTRSPSTRATSSSWPFAWLKFDVFNLLDNQKQIKWNTTVRQDATTPVDSLGLRTGHTLGPNYGKAEANGNFLILETFGDEQTESLAEWYWSYDERLCREPSQFGC